MGEALSKDFAVGEGMIEAQEGVLQAEALAQGVELQAEA